MTETDPTDTIAELIGRIASIPPPTPNLDIYTAGMASTDALELLVELEDGFGVSIPDDRFIEARTVAQLVTLVSNLRAEVA